MHFAFGKSHQQALNLQRIVHGVMSVTALAMALASLSARAQGAGYWHTSGSKIVDANGVTVRLAGINWYGAETPDYLVHGLWAQDYKTVLNTIKSLGYNVIRIPFSNQLVESNPVPTNYTSYANGGVVNSQLVGQTALQDLDTIIAYAGSIGLRVILDNHRSEAGETNEASGLWYTSAYPQANWIADWKTMATRYSASTFTFNGNPTVIGMDLRNEPHLSGSGATTGSCWTGDTATNGCPVSLTAQNWPVAAEAAGNAILAINPKLLIFVEGNDCYSGVCGWQGGNLIGVANYPVTLSVANQLVYSAHDYGPNLYQQSWFNGSTTPTSLDATWNKYWGYISGAGIAPVWLGEFGTDNTNTDIESTAAGSQGQWFESLVSYLQSNPSVNWTYWALNGEDTYDLLNGNYDATPVSSLKQSLLTSIQFPLSGGSTTPGFTLAPSASALAIMQGKTATDTITVTDVGGFTGSVTLAATGLPTGVTVAYGTNPTTSTSVLTFTASATATTGTATVTITGTSGSTTATTSFTLTVSSASGFPLAASPTALSVTQGSTATDTITVTDVGGFTGSVTLAASGLPSGVTAAFGTNPATSTSVLTLTASSTATTGTSTVTITGTSGSTTATTTISLTVTSSACTPTTIVPYISVNGGSTWTEESAATVSSTTTAVDLGPQPTTGTWSWTGPNGFTSTARQINSIALSTGANVYVATYTNSNSCKSTEPFTITVTGTTPSFTLSRSASSLAVAQGSSATDTITVTDVGGFTGSVTLAATGLPSGVTVVYGTNPTTGSSVLTFTASATATAGTATVTITGTSGTLTATITINLTVSASGFTLAASPTALSVTQGKTATDTVTVTDVGGFTGSVTLAAMGLPSGVTVTYGTNPTTGTSGLTFTASATATAGTYTVTITGTSGSTTATTTIPLTVVPSTGSFTIASSPTTCTLPQGGSCTVTITITDVSPFAGSVTLSASGLPSGVTVAFGTNPTTTTSVLTFTASSTATVGTSTVTITGTSGTLTGSVTIALTVTTAGSGYAATAKANFLAMYGDMNAANGYFSPLGIPYHSVETFMVEAPDYGHETVSETYSYYIWLTAMYGAIDGNWAPLTTAWDNMQTYMIPSAAQQPTNAGYNPSAPATYCPSYDSPSGYPCQFTTATVGIDPLSAELNSAYGNPNIYAMHWILDTTNWYGYGIDESGPGTAGAPSFYNSYQRGPMESVWLTIPQPSWDIFKYGNTSDGGYLSLFTGGTYTQQWKYTDAPDADARAIQAMYWAQQWSADNSTVAALLPNASKLGDYLRYSFYDKYFKEQGCQSTSCPVENGTKNSSAYLLSWYYAWGGAVPADGSWAWRIGSSDVHFGYQNPVAAYALSTDTSLIPKGSTAKTDWTTTLQRTLEFYRWLQSSQGAIAGGATNSWGGGSNTANPPTAWGGQYAVPPAGTPTFYGMSYIFAPSYGNPPSNQWFGMQAWSMERLAEYYYISGNADAKIILDPWIAWVEANSTVSATAWSIPSTIGWSGQPALNWNASTQNWTPGTAFNAGLNVSIVNSGEDVGVTGSLCKALLYYSAGTAKYGTQDMTSFNLAKSLLQAMWTVGRDSIGVSTPETRTDYSNLNIPIYVPSGWTGTMPNGDPINSSSTFLSIRTQYETDPNYAMVAAYAANPSTAPVPTFNYHRFWAQTDVATAYGAYYLLFPND